MNFIRRSKKGFALIFVILIAAAMMIPILMLLSSTIPRRTDVVGEAVSDRVLSVSDATIDNILNQINTFPFTFSVNSVKGETQADALTKAQDYLISYYISQLNGGLPDISDPVGSYNLISGYVSTYIYNLNTQEYYVVWDSPNSRIAHVSSVGPTGDVVTTPLKSLSSGSIATIASIDSNYTTDNLWLEIDTNTKYWPVEPDKWDIKTTAYLMSKTDIKRTIEAIASRGTASPTADEFADGTWFTHDTYTTSTIHNFSDYSGLYNDRVYFGRFETTTGMIRSNADIYMGGWAHDAIFAHGTVTDQAVDDGYKNDGQFGPLAKNLNWAKANKYATDGYPAAQFPNGQLALTGTNPVRYPPDPNGGLQDKAGSDYYVNGSATIVFNANGTVTINGNTLPMPPNGAIYVEGTATVSGTVKGQCTVGAGGDINIGGNIIYNTPPRLDRNEPMPPNPDLLGLIAHNNILIPVATFNANNHLEIDAAMLAVNGNFGIGSGYSWHPINGSGTYEAWWNGCQATYLTSNAPAIVSGSSIEGYDIQHTNYDWNLYDYGPPPFYPATGSAETTNTIDNYPAVTDSTLVNKDTGILTHLKKSQLTPITDPTIPYSYMYVYNGVTYYYGNTFDWYANAAMSKTALYRISWKEQIANPVKP
jgi:hypothetical protein